MNVKFDILYGHQTIRSDQHFRIVPPTLKEIRRQRWHERRVRYLEPAIDALWFALAFMLLKVALSI